MILDLVQGPTSPGPWVPSPSIIKIGKKGNHRTNTAKLDLNRQWEMPSKEQSPTIYHLKGLMANLGQFLVRVSLICRSPWVGAGCPWAVLIPGPPKIPDSDAKK